MRTRETATAITPLEPADRNDPEAIAARIDDTVEDAFAELTDRLSGAENFTVESIEVGTLRIEDHHYARATIIASTRRREV